MFEWEHLRTFYFDGADCPNGVTIAPDIFSNSSLLKDLTIRGSKQGYQKLIKNLNIKDLKYLKALDLSNNNISYISDAKDFPRLLEKLDLSENPLQFSKAIQKLNIPCIYIKDGRKCFDANSIRKELCSNSHNKSDCQDIFVENLSIWIILITIIVIFILLLLGGIFYYFYFRSPILWNNIGVKFFKRRHLHEDLKNDFKYDIFIVGHDNKFCECKNIDDSAALWDEGQKLNVFVCHI